MDKNSFSIPDTIMLPDSTSCFVYPIRIKEEVKRGSLLLPKTVTTEYRNKEKVDVETMRRIIVKSGHIFQASLAIPTFKIFGLVITKLLPRPGDEIVRMEQREMAASSPTILDPNTFDKFEIHHQMEVRSIIYNSTITRPWHEKLAIKRIHKLKTPWISIP